MQATQLVDVLLQSNLCRREADMAKISPWKSQIGISRFFHNIKTSIFLAKLFVNGLA